MHAHKCADKRQVSQRGSWNNLTREPA